jgi:hypothetical protein
MWGLVDVAPRIAGSCSLRQQHPLTVSFGQAPLGCDLLPSRQQPVGHGVPASQVDNLPASIGQLDRGKCVVVGWRRGCKVDDVDNAAAQRDTLARAGPPGRLGRHGWRRIDLHGIDGVYGWLLRTGVATPQSEGSDKHAAADMTRVHCGWV